MKKSKILLLVLIGLLMATGLVLAGCESLGDFATGYSAGYTTTSDTGLVYTFYNYSSQTVTIWDQTGSREIPKGGNTSARFNKDANIYQVRYEPADKVSSSISGTTVTFRDR
jgi:hypothetical protein